MKYLIYAALLLVAIPALAVEEGAYGQPPAAAAAPAPAAVPAPAPAMTQPSAAAPMDQNMSMFMGNLLRDYYGISASDLATWRARGYSDADIAMAANVAARTGTTPPQILALRDQRRSWEEIARQYNMSTADVFALAPRTMSEQELAFQRSMLMRTYGLTEAEINSLLRTGHTADEISMAANIAVRTNRPVSDVLALRGQGMSWTEIASRYNLEPGMLMRPYVMVPAEEDAYFREYLRSRFNVSIASYNRYRTQGWLPEEIHFASHVAARSRQPLDFVLQLRDQGMSWREIASRLGISIAELTTPMPIERVAGVVQREMPMGPGEVRRHEPKTWEYGPYMDQAERQREMERQRATPREREMERPGYPYE